MKKLKLLTLLLSVFVFSCSSSDDDDSQLPVLTTTEISGIANTTAVSGGTISNDGGSAITARGVVWSTTENPTTANSKTSDGDGTGNFASSLTELVANTNYYLRAYATNVAGTAYGNQLSFTTTNVPAAGSTREFILDITHVRDGSSRNISGSGSVNACMFVDGISFDMDPYAENYTVSFYDMSRTMEGQPTTYPANATYTFNANAGSEMINGPYGTGTLINWYNAGAMGSVTRITPQQKLWVMASWCTTSNCIDTCYWVNGKAKVTVHY